MHAADPLTVTFLALPEELPESFCILRAHRAPNRSLGPGSGCQGDENPTARLDGLHLPRARIMILAADNSAAEAGWAVPCSLHQGLDLARESGQATCYPVEAGRLALVQCGDGSQTNLGSFADRLRDPRQRRLFTIHIGSPRPRARLLATEELDVRVRASRHLGSCTITRGEHCRHNEAEDALLICAATDNPRRIIEFAMEFPGHAGPRAIGISCNGMFQPITPGIDHGFLLHVWGFSGDSAALTPSMSATST